MRITWEVIQPDQVCDMPHQLEGILKHWGIPVLAAEQIPILKGIRMCCEMEGHGLSVQCIDKMLSHLDRGRDIKLSRT